MTVNPSKPIQVVLAFLKICGLWPNHKRCYTPYIAYAIIFQFIFTFAYTSFKVTNFFFLTEVNVITKALFICLSEVALFAKVINFHFYNKELQQMLADIEEFKLMNQCEEGIIRKKHLLFNRILLFQMICAEIAIIFSCASPFFLIEPTLPYPGWYPLDWRNDVQSYFIVFVYQVIGIVFVSHSIILTEAYAMFLMVMASAHLEILAIRLEKLGCVSDNQKQNKVLRRLHTEEYSLFTDCVRIYATLSRFQTSIQEFFSIPIFIQFIISGMVLCVTVFQIVTMNPANEIANLIFYITYAATILMEIFLPCYFGTELTLKNDFLLTAIYSSNWMEYPVYFQKMIIIFMEFLKMPMILISGKLFSLTLNSFLLVLNRTYSLFAVLRNFLK